MESLTFEIKYSEARHLPIVTAFAKKLGIIEEVDRLIDGQMEISPRRVVLGLILDTLSGRTPLFRLHEFFAHHDTGLLVGQDIPAKKFNNVGRVLDRIFAVGTQQILGAISLNAVKMFDLELKAVHFDTTSRNLYGDKVAQLQQEAGCFVLLTSRPAVTHSAAEVLKLYKDQHYIEQNFAFLKDPVIINEIFLKKPERIEALGLIFVLALMIWRLIERTMRQTLEENQDKVPGWDRKPTDKPTAFMMSTKFSSVPWASSRSAGCVALTTP